MIEHVNNLKFQYLVELSKQGDRCLKYREQVSKHLVDNNVVFGKDPIPFLLMPHFLSEKQLAIIREVVHHLSNVLEKFVQSYLEDERYRKELRITPEEDALYRVDPGYGRAVCIARLDAFLAQYQVNFLEFNCDSPAGIGYSDRLYEGLSKTLDLPDVHYEFEEGYEKMLPHLHDTLMGLYAKFRANGHLDFPEKPTVAIIDFDCITASEFKIVQQYLESRGLRTFIGDPREVKRGAGGWPELNGERIHLFYRRALVRQLLKDAAFVKPFVDSVREQAACCVNPFRSVLAGNKKVMAFLLDEEWQRSCLTEEEIEVVHHTVPWTRILRDEKTHYDGWRVNLRDWVSDNRDRLVIKPAKGYAGQGVHLGMETPQSKWDAVLAEALADREQNWVVQEFIPIPQEMFPVIENNHLAVKLKKFNINPFALAGEFAGIITRISDSSVINVTANGGLLPCVQGSLKQHLFERR